MKDYYKILNLNQNASKEEVRKRYKELALKFHPDVSHHEKAHQLFLEINEAYQILSDYNKRQYYDYVYNKYKYAAAQQHQKEQVFKENLKNKYRQNQKQNEHKKNIKYAEYIKNLNCFFNPAYKANGSPYNYSMYKIIYKKQGVRANETIPSKVINIPIPRSKKSLLIHQIGFSIKLFFLVLTIIFCFSKLFSVLNFYQKITIPASILLFGGLLTHSVYRFSNTKSKFLNARKYHLVQAYLKKGFNTGFHPAVSIPPFNLIAILIKILL